MNTPKTPQKRGIASREKILETISRLSKERGYPPTLREISKETNLSLVGVAYHLQKLRTQNKVVWQPRENRTLRLVE